VSGTVVDNPFPIAGIGASAGGLDALGRLLSTLPARPGLALVVVQHLDPHAESQLTVILRNKSAIRVVDAKHGTKVRPDHAYVIQPNTNVALADGVLSVTARPDDRRPHYPVDHFLRSLAAVQGPHSVGVILSGTGSDGTLGMGEIKAAGGVTFAQDDATAQHGGMPQSAIASGVVDLVLSPEEIGRQLGRLPDHPYLAPAGPLPARDESDDFRRILTALRTATGVDFSQYRDTTLRRRTSRRMLLRGYRSGREYAQLLEQDPVEAEALYRDVLINVTSFFREPEMFEELKAVVLPDIVNGKPDSQPIRIWVPGCSTGQEPYSLAMSLIEYLQTAGLKREIQVFATDVGSPASLEFARAGIYPESIETEVSPERLRRFFTKESRSYRIQKAVRDLCVFARQNVAVDPPFSRVDLVSCRNVLIYMSPALQERLLPIFHFSLNPGGFLVLGVAETVGSFTELFEPVSRGQKLFRRKDTLNRMPMTFISDDWLPANATRTTGTPAPAPDSQREADRLTLGRYAPPAVLIDENFDVRQYRGRTAPFLEPPAGQPTANILRMVRDGLFQELRTALTEAKASKAPVVREGLHMVKGSDEIDFTLRILPVSTAGTTGTFFLVLFETKDWPAWSTSLARVPEGTPGESDAAWLRQELDASKQYMESMLDAQDAANQELRAAHEEVLSSNEELQSTNEELETTKEELQSANEELTTVNEQFQTRNRELSVLSDDLANFISSAGVPMVTVARDLTIRGLTPAAQRAFNLLPADVGRSIEHIKFALDIDGIGDVIESVIVTMQPWERELTDRQGRWWLLRVHPYLTGDNRIDGATLVAIDINSIKHHHDLVEARDYALAVVQTVREPMVVLDATATVGLANESFYELFGETPANAEGKALWETSRGVWSDLPLRRTLLAACEGREDISNLEIQRVLASRGLRTLVLNARAIARVGRPGLLLLSVDDVTDARQAERLRIDAETLRLVDRRKDEFLGILAHELRNPLAPMRYALEMLRRTTGSAPDGLRARAVLERQVQHLVRIVDDLLDVSRITQGKVELRPETLSIAEVVRSAVELSRPAVAAAGHSLTVTLPDEPLLVNADPVRLTQVFVNLLNNAVKFTPRGGQIWIVGEHVGETPGEPDHVRIRVRDTGIGIAADQRQTVFDMFMQGDRSLERTRAGLGVGLTLVRNLVALHGGSIDVWSEGAGLGSEFIVSLPLENVPSESPTLRSDAPPAPSRSLRVLVADDNDDGRDLLAYLLSKEGHQVISAVDGDDALQQVLTLAPDVAILDIGMPGINGYELARRIRELAAEPAPLLIALSGLGQAEDKARAAAAGFDQHFTKPLEIGMLLGVLAERFN
jgi:two-component system CheB/CheR fusion protein